MLSFNFLFFCVWCVHVDGANSVITPLFILPLLHAIGYRPLEVAGLGIRAGSLVTFHFSLTSSSGVISSWILAGKEGCGLPCGQDLGVEDTGMPSWYDARQFPNTSFECHLVTYCWIIRDPVFEASLGCGHSIDFYMLSDIFCSIWVQILVL